jgi:hypothetical protein
MVVCVIAAGLTGIRSRVIAGLVVLAGVCNASAQFCPPVPQPPAVQVPGKPGEMGWMIPGAEEADANGNKLQQWCLKATPGPNPPAHGGNDLAFLYVPAPPKLPSDAVWVGACVFPGAAGSPAMNVPNKDFKLGADGKPILKNGVPEQFATVTWHNFEPYPAGTHDWDYSYDTATGMLSLSKTQGAWFDKVDPQTGTVFSHAYGYMDPTDPTHTVKPPKVIGTDTYTAPTNFGDIKYKGDKVTDASGSPGLSAETFAAVAQVAGHNWSYTLTVNSLGGSGTAANPYLGSLADVMAGDTFSISGTGIEDPSVSSPASLPEYGGWVVQSSSSNSVTFMATANTEFVPGFPIPGFGFSSAAPAGTVAWYLASSNEAIGSSGVVSGPMTPPDQLHLSGPSPNTIPVGQDGTLVATVESGFVPMPGKTLRFTKLAGDFRFDNGTLSSGGTTTTLTTATNGAAVADVTAGSAGMGFIQVNIEGTALSAYLVFFMH